LQGAITAEEKCNGMDAYGRAPDQTVSHEKKQALVEGDAERLKRLSKRRS
jgi:hypothetical protein